VSAPWRKPLAIHDPAKVLLDLAVALGLGGDCLAGIAVVRAEPAVFGLVASDPTVSRTIDALAKDAPAALRAIHAARAVARERAGRPACPARRDRRGRHAGDGAPAVRKLLYTTSIESLNYQLRKVTKARGHFPDDDAVVKLLWLAIINIEDKRARERAARRQATGKRSDQPARLVEGQRVMGWREALSEPDAAYPGRLR
jgi:hypothetical protein